MVEPILVMKKSWKSLEYDPSKSKSHRDPDAARQVMAVPAALGLAPLFRPLQVWVPPEGVVMSMGPVVMSPSYIVSVAPSMRRLKLGFAVSKRIVCFQGWNDSSYVTQGPDPHEPAKPLTLFPFEQYASDGTDTAIVVVTVADSVAVESVAS